MVVFRFVFGGFRSTICGFSLEQTNFSLSLKSFIACSTSFRVEALWEFPHVHKPVNSYCPFYILGNYIIEIFWVKHLCYTYKIHIHLTADALVLWLWESFHLSFSMFPEPSCDVSIGVGYHIVSSSLHLDQLCLSVKVIICCKKKLPLWEVRTTFICGPKNK